jgi:hypothetical protein
MTTLISPKTDGDLEAVLALWSDTEGVGLNESDTPDQLNIYLNRNPGLSLVVRNNERIIGAVLCGHDGRRGYLHHPGSTSAGRCITLPPSISHCLKVPNHFEVNPCFCDAICNSIGLTPLYRRLEEMFVGKPAFAFDVHGCRQGGKLPLFNASII